MTDANPALAEVVESVGIRLRCLGQPALALAAALAYGVVVHLHDPTQPGNYPTCPFLWLTGWACPGCGTLRASHELTEGNVVGALAYNPLTGTWGRDPGDLDVNYMLCAEKSGATG